MYKVIFTHPYGEVGWILFSSKWTFHELCQSGRLSILDLYVIFGMFHMHRKTTDHNFAFKSLREKQENGSV